MEGLEIVVTPRTVERFIYVALILVLGGLLIFSWVRDSCSQINETTGSVIAEPKKNLTNTTLALETPTELDACENGVKDKSETDVDCGGSCEPCAEFSACNLDADCDSGLFCFQHIKCLKPSCSDQIKNQDEKQVDCGGICGGYWWSDSKCHNTTEPSGKLTVKLSGDVTQSELSQNAVLNTLRMNLENGLSKTLFMTAAVYAYTDRGSPVYEDREGNLVALQTVELEPLQPNGKMSYTFDFTESTRRTLAGVDGDSAYKLMVQFEDENGALIDKVYWTNN